MSALRSMLVRFVMLGMGGALLACGGATPTDPTTANTTTAAATTDPPPDPHPEIEAPTQLTETADGVLLRARGEGPTEAEAVTAADAHLAEQLLGAPSWTELFEQGLHAAGDDAAEVSQEGGTFTAELTLSREQVDTLLSGLRERDVDVDAPDAWAEPVDAFIRAHTARHACERLVALLSTECEPPDTSEADAAMAALASSLSLASPYLGGLPLDENGRPHRPATAVLSMNARPLPGVRLVASPSTPDVLAADHGLTDSSGQVTFALSDGTAWSGPIEISVDAASFLGPLAERWNAPAIAIDGRPADLSRWSAIVDEHVQGSRVTDTVFSRSLTQALRRAGAQDPTVLPANIARRLGRTNERARTRMLPSVANQMLGRLDTLLVVDVDSEFANRMGSTRVWYEARGSIEAYDAWTGRLLTTVEASTTASGVGEQRADQAARTELAQILFDRLLAEPTISLSPQAGRPSS